MSIIMIDGNIIPCIGNDWDVVLRSFWLREDVQIVLKRVEMSYAEKIIYPPKEDVFNAFRMTPFAETRVVILGQDPYIREGQAHGLSFSVLPTVHPIPPSLRNIFIELRDEMGCYIPNNGYLASWAYQGVLMLNSILTVEAGKSHSHANIGWDFITDYVISTLNEKSDHSIVFMLWGNAAKTKAKLIDPNSHLILEAAHPSPLAGGKFFGCDHFIKCNNYLYEISPNTIDWQIPNIQQI